MTGEGQVRHASLSQSTPVGSQQNALYSLHDILQQRRLKPGVEQIIVDIDNILTAQSITRPWIVNYKSRQDYEEYKIIN